MKTQKATASEILRALYRKPNKKNLDIETQLVQSCLDYLGTLRGVKVWRQNTGGRDWIDAKGRRRYVAFGQPGQGDISGIAADGRRIEIEVKKPGEVPTELQREWLNMIEQHRGISFWCSSIEDCIYGCKLAGLA